MNRPLSIYLDLLRLGAAAVVFLGHAGTQRISGGLLHQFGLYGEAAVDVFFVLSGFVIAHVVATREGTPRSYVVNRIARIYSVVVPALLLGLLLDALGARLDPVLYTQVPDFAGPAPPGQLASALLFLDQLWFRADQPGSNLPYWSLGFEVWYYIAFGVFAFAPKPWNAVLALAVMLVAGPKIALLAPLWLLGVAAQRICAADLVPRRAGWLLLLGPFVLLALWPDPFTRPCYPYRPFDPDPACVASYGQDFGFGLLVALHLLGVHALADRLGPLLERIARPVRWLAGASFTIYLVHYPLIHFLVALSPWPAPDWATRALVFLGGPLLLLAIAALTERRKESWRRGIATLLARWGTA